MKRLVTAQSGVLLTLDVSHRGSTERRCCCRRRCVICLQLLQQANQLPGVALPSRCILHDVRSTQPCIPPVSLNRVPASAGVKAGVSPLPGGR